MHVKAKNNLLIVQVVPFSTLCAFNTYIVYTHTHTHTHTHVFRTQNMIFDCKSVGRWDRKDIYLIFTVCLLRNQIKWCYGEQVTEISALTGVALQLVGGSTLNSLFKVPVCRTETKHAPAARRHDIHRHFERLFFPAIKYIRIIRQQWQKCRVLVLSSCSRGRDIFGSIQ